MANFCLANRQRLLANVGWDSLMRPRSVSLKRIVLWTWSRSVFCHVPLSPRRKKSKEMYPPSFLRCCAEELFPDISFLPSFLLAKGREFAKHVSYMLKKGFSLTLITLITGSYSRPVRDLEGTSQRTLQGGMEISPLEGLWVNWVRVISGLCSVIQPWNSAAGDFKHSDSSVQRRCYIFLLSTKSNNPRVLLLNLYC